MQILIIGAGGQGQVVADIILFAREAGQDIDITGYLDDNSSYWNKEYLGFKVLGPIKRWQDIKHDKLIIGIGNNRLRSELYLELKSHGAIFTKVCHPKAVIGHDVIISEGSCVSAHVIIAAGTNVGCNSIIHGNTVIGHHNIIGDHVHIAPGVNTTGHVEIDNGAMVGINASIMPGRKVGEWATVGSATLVHKNVSPGTTVIGVPGRLL